MKKCIDCDIILNDNNWSNSKQKKRYYICNKCDAKRNANYRFKKPWVTRINNIIRIAKVEGHRWYLPKIYAYHLISSPCYYCGQILENFNGIDRVDSSKEYTKDNCVSCCKYCNWAKNDLSISEFKNHINKINNYLKEKSLI